MTPYRLARIGSNGYRWNGATKAPRTGVLAELLDAIEAADVAVNDGQEAARTAARRYIRRRLQQLGRRFGRHRFWLQTKGPYSATVYLDPPFRYSGMVPVHGARSSLRCMTHGRAQRYPTIRGLFAVIDDLEGLCQAILDRYGLEVGHVYPEEQESREMTDPAADAVRASLYEPRGKGKRGSGNGGYF